MTTALILFAHGARDPEWANPMRAVQARVAEQAGAVDVRLAFLEFMSPTLGEAVSEVAAGGADHIVILPMFIARGGHLKRELPEMIGQLRLAYPDIDFSLAPVIGEQERVIQAFAEHNISIPYPVQEVKVYRGDAADENESERTRQTP